MNPSTSDSAAKKMFTVRGIEFHLEELSNGRGFKVLADQICVAGKKLKLASGLPLKLAKLVKRQPSFGLHTAKVVKDNEILFEFDKPVEKIKDDSLEQHVFVPMARNIRRVHHADLPPKDDPSETNARKGLLSEPALA